MTAASVLVAGDELKYTVPALPKMDDLQLLQTVWKQRNKRHTDAIQSSAAPPILMIAVFNLEQSAGYAPSAG
jgi:hypothetical protein